MLRRLVLVLSVALVMAAMAVAMAMPAFADSLASRANQTGFGGPSDGSNFGQCTEFVGQGTTTALANPSDKGGPGHLPGSFLCPKP
jgi:hypothetical protein